jgi:hypothetical protein
VLGVEKRMQRRKTVPTDTKTEHQTPPNSLGQCGRSIEANPNLAHFQLHVSLAEELLGCEWSSHDVGKQHLPLEVLHLHVYIDTHPGGSGPEYRTLEHGSLNGE